ncbi:MAG: class I SAM-dependent methyltransferase [Planctomycetia bacterium]|nr:class I SAM-dependent methyltransferase [Planctomycetia bacterium]
MNAPHPGKFRDPALVDFGLDSAGDGRRLERLAGILVDRPLPQTGDRRRLAGEWRAAQAVYRLADSSSADAPCGRWEFTGDLPDPWVTRVTIGTATLVLEVHPAPSGQIGIFLEQIDQWRWLQRTTPTGSTVLSLFAHSGAATLAAASAGAEVVHVDASRQSIALARRNAAASGLAHLPVSWVCEDAATFVQRCLRRGRRFSGVILDPPSWGHGPKGQSFSIQRDLPGLLADIARLLDPSALGPILLTCHSPGWHPGRLRDTLSDSLRAAAVSVSARIESGSLTCTDDTGRTIDLGSFARVTPAS